MSNSPNLALPYIDQNQSQKHVTHNEALRELDAIVQLSVIDDSLTAPPGSPADGDRYIVAASATGAWAGKEGKVAAWQDGAWSVYAPKAGWLAFVESRSAAYLYASGTWVPLVSAIGALAGLAGIGILSTADATNRLSVKSDAALFTHDDVTPGTGDMRFTLNKKTAAHTVSQLYQSNWSGRAETGLTGDDNFHVKVSPDGASWKEAILVDRSTGEVSLPFTAACKITVFNSSGTWTRDARTVAADVILWGGGGGGGSGARQASGSASSGGGGGGAGFIQRARYTAAQLGASQAVAIGAGGTPGAARTADNTAGNDGGAGGNSSFGSLVLARGGGAGAGGGLGIGSGGGSSGQMATSAVNGSGATGGAAASLGGASGGSAAAGASNTVLGGGGGGGGGVSGAAGSVGGGGAYGSSGGGAGGGISAGGVAAAGGNAGSLYRTGSGVSASGGAAGVSGTSGANASLTTGPIDVGGTGGGGGGAHATTPGAGGGGGVGAGGGGGGASQNGASSGAGGAGGPGQCVVIEYF